MLVVTPADQTVTDEAAFVAALQQAVRLAAEGGITILGITPDRPETGYGYIRTLADNAGLEGALIVSEAKRRKGNEGLNIANNEWVDLVKAGVVDPTKVTRSALQHAASISGLLLTTEALITEIPEKKAAPAGGDHHGHGGGDF